MDSLSLQLQLSFQTGCLMVIPSVKDIAIYHCMHLYSTWLYGFQQIDNKKQSRALC